MPIKKTLVTTIYGEECWKERRYEHVEYLEKAKEDAILGFDFDSMISNIDSYFASKNISKSPIIYKKMIEMYRDVGLSRRLNTSREELEKFTGSKYFKDKRIWKGFKEEALNKLINERNSFYDLETKMKECGV